MARQSYAQAKAQGTLAGLTVADIMAHDAPTVARDLSLEEYGQEVARSKSRTHLVVGDGQLAGLMTLDALKTVPQTEWATTSVQAVMLPRERVFWTDAGGNRAGAHGANAARKSCRKSRWWMTTGWWVW